MGKTCKVNGCGTSSDYREEKKWTLFSPPKNEDERNKWVEILQCDLTSKHCVVCEKHFRVSDVITHYERRSDTGQLLISYKYKIKRLKPNTLPLRPGEENVKQESKDVAENAEYKSEENNINTSNSQGRINGFNTDSQSHKYLKESSNKNSSLPTENKDVDNYQNSLNTFVFDHDYVYPNQTLVLPNSTLDSNENIHYSKEVDKSTCLVELKESSQLNSEQLYLLLRENILNNKCNVKLPNERWGIHKCSKTKTVMFSYMEAVPIEDEPERIIPKCRKRAAFGNTLEFYLDNKEVKMASVVKPTSVDELEQNLQKFENFNYCIGGPTTTSYRAIINPKQAVVDGKRWRHINCEGILERGLMCKKCYELPQTLSRYYDKQYKQKTSKKLKT